MQDINFNHLKIKVNETYNGDEKIKINFEPSNDEDVTNKAFLDGKLSIIERHISYVEKDYNENKLLSSKQSVGEILIQRALETTIQKFYDKGCLIIMTKMMRCQKTFFVERSVLRELNDDNFIQGFY